MGIVPEPTTEADAWISLAREHLALGRPLSARVTGLSMWPLLRPGARVVINPGRPVIGDLALIELRSTLVLHRVVAARPGRLLTKGDAVALPDPEVALGDVLGVVDGGPGKVLVARLSIAGGAPLAAVLRRLRVALSRLS